jgi:tetratricopeptide (TPR) repeat protein
VTEARAAFRRATEANPRDARAWFELGNILEGREAAEAWVHAAQADPWDLRASRRAAQAFVRLGDVGAAIGVLQASIGTHARPDADYAADHVNLAFMRADREQTTAAIDHLRAAVRGDPNYVRSAVPRMAEAVRANPRADLEFVEALDELERGGMP